MPSVARRRTVTGQGVAMQVVMTIQFAVILARGSPIFVGSTVLGFFVFAYSWYTR